MQRSSNAEIPEKIARNSVRSDNQNVIEEMSLTQFTDEYFASLNPPDGN